LSGALIPELHLPGPNAFIPEDLDVKKIEGKEVRRPRSFRIWLIPPIARAKTQLAKGYGSQSVVAQKG
jgi:hypothetical protein